MISKVLVSAAVSTLVSLAWVNDASAQAAPAIERSGNTFHTRVCADPGQVGVAHCHAHIVTDRIGNLRAHKIAPSDRTTLGAVPYYARDLQNAYYGSSFSIPTVKPVGMPTVAVVDAYGYSNAAQDLATYRRQNGLPPLCSSSVTTGCVNFKKYNQSGIQGNYPRNNSGWAQESALDIQMVSAMCPWCDIALVEANSATYSNLAAAEFSASKLPGVIAVSNSYGGGESGTSAYNAYYSPSNTITNGYPGLLNPKVAITASSGDGGYGVSFPASSPYVIAVGGTALSYIAPNWSQTAWVSAGSGCSSTYLQMPWQTPSLPGINNPCASGRVVADVSAVADPNTGVAVIMGNSVYQFGGTSVSAPIIAGIIGQNNIPTSGYGANLYTNAGKLSDVTSGSNGSCGGTYLCKSVMGYDGPTGLGTPNGIINLMPF